MAHILYGENAGGVVQWLFMLFLVAVCTLGHAASTRAAIKEIEATGTFHLGDNDTRIEGRRLALEEAKRNALEQVGTYIESITELRNAQVTRDEIKTYTAGIVETTVMGDPKWEMEGRKVTLSIRARIDTDVVAKQILALRTNEETTQALADARAKIEQYERQVSDLNRQMKSAKGPMVQKLRASRNDALKGIDVTNLLVKATFALTGIEDLESGYVTGKVSKSSLQRARTYTEDALKIDPKNVDALTLMASILIEEGDAEGAERILRGAVREEPDHAMALGTLAFALNRQKRNDEAIQLTRRAIQLKPNNAPLHVNLGYFLYEGGQKAEAIRELQEAVRVDPNSAMAHAALAAFLEREFMWKEARSEYEEACRLGDATSCERSHPRLLGCAPIAGADEGGNETFPHVDLTLLGLPIVLLLLRKAKLSAGGSRSQRPCCRTSYGTSDAVRVRSGRWR